MLDSSTLDKQTEKAIAVLVGYLVERYGKDYCTNLSQQIRTRGLDKTPIGQAFAHCLYLCLYHSLYDEGQLHREAKPMPPDPDFDAFVAQWNRNLESHPYGEVL